MMPSSASGVIDLSGWREDEDFAFHPIGSQPKRTLVCPIAASHPRLIPGHRYIFKTALKTYQGPQLWSEVIACRIGRLAGVVVPPCFVAVDPATGEAGALMEFFYGYPGEPAPARLVHGSDLLHRFVVANVRTRPHGVLTNLEICRALRVREAEAWWGKLLVFDALIGNTDRHPGNWGFLLRRPNGNTSVCTMAPVYDNGTSLGYERAESKLMAVTNAQLSTYVARGTHDCGWSADEDGPTSHLDLVQRYVQAHPAAGEAMKSVIQVDCHKLDRELAQMTTFGVSVPFSSERAAFVSALVRMRQAKLLACLGS
jgi:hypothetical protein